MKIVFAVLFGAAIVGQKLHTSTFSSVQKFLDTLKMIVTLDKIIIKKNMVFSELTSFVLGHFYNYV